MKKKKWYMIIVGSGFLMVGLLVSVLGIRDAKWEYLHEMKEYEELFDNSITEITLRQTVDSPEWVVFGDEDLIEMWDVIFHKLEVKEYHAIWGMNLPTNGGGKVIKVRTAQEDYTFIIKEISGEHVLEINGQLYCIKENLDIPFGKSYRIAIARYGTQSIFD